MKKLFIGLAILFSVTVQAQVSIYRLPNFVGRTDSARVHVSEMLNGKVIDRSIRIDSLPGNWVDGKLHLKSLGSGTSATLNTLLSLSRTVIIDTVLNIDADVTIPAGTNIEVDPRAIIYTANSAKLLIQGNLKAGPYQIFDTAANVKIRPYSVLEIYPEWFGAKALENPRSVTLTGSDINSTNAFKKAVSFVESRYYATKVYGAKIRLSGWYGINDQIDVYSNIMFEGTVPEMEGTGLRWIGNTVGDSAKSMLVFYQSEYGGVRNIGFKGNNTTDTTMRLKAAITLRYQSGLFTQRKMLFENIIIGDITGVWIDNAAGYNFRNGILCDGTSGNNDFHTFRNMSFSGCDIGIHNTPDQSVEWQIDNYTFAQGGIMYQSDFGGSVIGNRWYAAQSTKVGVINVLGGVSQELRMSLSNFNCEHLQCEYFIQSQAKMKFIVSGESIVDFNPNYRDSTDGFALIKGAGVTFDSEFTFDNVRLQSGYTSAVVNSTPRMYIETSSTSGAIRRSVLFRNCTGAKAIMYKISPTSTNAYTSVSIKGEKTIAGTTNTQMDKDILVGLHNPGAVLYNGNYWVNLNNNFFDNETDVDNNVVNIGKRGSTTQTGLTVKGVRAVTLNSQEQVVRSVLPANSVIKGVTCYAFSANILASATINYLTVGTLKNEQLFGTIAMPTANLYNTIQASSFTTGDTAENIVVKGWRNISSATYTLSGTTLTSSSGSSFTSDMTGSRVKITNGSNAGKEMLVTGYTSGSVVSVDNLTSLSGSGFTAITEQTLTSGKPIIFSITYEELGKNKAELNLVYTPSLPTATVEIRTPVANEKQYASNFIDTTLFVSAYDTTVLRTGATQSPRNKTFDGSLNTFTNINTSALVGAITVVGGGTGNASYTPYALIAGGTTSTSALQQLATGTAGQALISSGASALPVWSDLPGGGNALTSSPLSQFATTTSAQLAGVVTDALGTGFFIRSPSVLGTAALVADNTLVHLSGTETISGAKTFSATTTAVAGLTVSTISNFYSPALQTALTSGSHTLGGSSRMGLRLSLGYGSTAYTVAANESYASVLAASGGVATTIASTGTHPIFAQLAVKALTISTGSGTLTNAATFYIEGAATGTGIPSNNYALMIAAGALQLGAATTTSPSFNIPTGVAPTSPKNGDVWSDGSNLFIRLGGVTYTITKS